MNLNLLKYKKDLILKKEGKHKKIYDPIRKKYLILGPEEIVRQLLIQYLIQEKSYPQNYISVEKEISVNELKKRYDILVFDKQHQPFLLVECKAPEVPINETTFSQIAWYNMPLKVSYLLVSNGLQTFCCKMNYSENSYEFLNKIPDLLEQQ